MKYYTLFTSEGPQLVNTLGDLKAAGQKKVEVRDVPTDKDGLRDFVNALYKEAYSRTPTQEVVPGPTSAKTSAKLDTDTVIEFILDAESYHFSNIFSAVVERFDRLKKEIFNAKSSTS